MMILRILVGLGILRLCLSFFPLGLFYGMCFIGLLWILLGNFVSSRRTISAFFISFMFLCNLIIKVPFSYIFCIISIYFLIYTLRRMELKNVCMFKKVVSLYHDLRMLGNVFCCIVMFSQSVRSSCVSDVSLSIRF